MKEGVESTPDDLSRVEGKRGSGLRFSLRTLCIASLLHFEVSDFLKFRAISPSVSSMANGSFQIVERRTKYSLDDARFCIQYVTIYAIAMQGHMNESVGWMPSATCPTSSGVSIGRRW